ncbi:MAG: AMP-binding protein [Planctomycetes bacterium]|nr:AMP-binding protein [Planctomycetota bacterium]
MNPLLDAFETVCTERAERPATCDQSLVLDYQSFRAVAAGLAEQIAGGTERPHVGILAPTSSACAVAIFATWYAGKIPVPLNFLLAPDELGRVVRDAELDFVLTIERFAPAAAAGGLETLLLTPGTLVAGQRPAPSAAPGDTAVMLYTSGTSGVPKGVCLTFDNLVQNAQASIAQARMNADQVFLSVLPQFHSFGFTTLTVVPLLLGATVHYLPRFSPVTVMQTLAQKHVTVFIAIPSMFGALGQMKQGERAALAQLELAISGGEPLPARVADKFAERCGVAIHEGYGLTETSPVVSLNTPWARRTGSVGRPLPGVEVAAVDGHGHALPAGQDGELLVRGHGVMRGYYNNPEATAAVLRDAALWTGDIGHVDADGFIHITGRAKEMMIIGGENVFPLEIEGVLLDHPAVTEAAAIGAPDDLRGEVPVAFVILKEGASATETELRHFCRERLAGFKVPRDVHIAADLPHGPTGKILKRALKRDRR